MIILITSDNLDARRRYIDECMQTLPPSEVLMFDDTSGTVEALEEYAYPSLFNTQPSVIHSKFLLEGEMLATPLVKTLLASPTVFIFEEFAVPASVVTSFKKAGAIVHVGEKVVKQKVTDDIFAATKAITAVDKKSRWLSYRAALETHPIEAIMGVLYWKAKELSLKNKSYLALYRALLVAHARAWKEGTPLDLAIEKVILMQ